MEDFFGYLAPGTLERTFDRSTPVNACIVGGICEITFERLPVSPLSKTISSVFDKGADISAAI